jgi:hypothetical protein
MMDYVPSFERESLADKFPTNMIEQMVSTLYLLSFMSSWPKLRH